MAGITPNGFTKKDLFTIISDIKLEIQTKYPSVDLTDEGVFGQIINIFADKYSSLWDLLQATYASQYPDSASGVSMDNLFALNNLFRLGATRTCVKRVALTCSNATSLGVGDIVLSSTKYPDYRFSNITPESISAAGVMYIDLYCTVTGVVPVAIGDLDTTTFGVIESDSSGFVTAVANNNMSITGKTAESDTEFRLRRSKQLQNTYSGTELGIYNAVQALNDNESEQPIGFIKVVSNRRNTMDAKGRLPHSVELVVSDMAEYETITTASIAQNTNVLTPVTSAFDLLAVGDNIAVASSVPFGKEKFTITDINPVYPFDITLNTNYVGVSISDGSLEKITNGRDQEIAESFFKALPVGIDQNGTSNISVNDAFGDLVVIKMSHPAPVNVYMKLEINSTEPLTPEEKNDVFNYIATWGNNLGIGKDVVVYGYNCLVSQFVNDKVIDVRVGLSTTSMPTHVVDNQPNIEIDVTEYSSWSTANMEWA